MKLASIVFALLMVIAVSPVVKAQAPTFHVSHPPKSNITFEVDASVSIKGTFRKWDTTLTCPSTDPTSCVLEIKIDADSVDTGSGMKDGKLKGGDFFDAKNNPYITFKSTKIVQQGPDKAEIDGDFTIRGVTKQEKLSLLLKGAGTGSGSISGTMAFDRKDYGMNKGIPFIKIADRVQVTVDLHVTRTSGPAMVFPKN